VAPSTAEIAETLGLSIASVKTRTHRARLFLRKRLNAWLATHAAGAMASR
jgi:DNA-directed RNA polymerase specialized sigma24 family protein